uniref:Adhesin n=1 Tax=Streptococcus sanguinis SK1 = NCTC 7863 TaxID=888807 RepID=A0A7M4DUE2_STRSA|nr:Chain A, Adhesin [Streptococcus sanguinis SK1 = NCTC 7863]6VS7_E Chain E, Adhesin [Streptococcus sanguinis SK1 = NCTC 7863]6VT2_A Chain A, Adhesin [Streptococcus sanguinis SK1 = NCTC 7863]6VT2_E Chain E, Adhesin [Streptococcus sanguinis SK1 = NCTC 7863]6VU6_A Chain A, Adhesin [Streptococcus sanguinis SK1 = NCTC 7863]6VU6_E Chain E, Adhesin [Streptococcus sanguinis SK1 = NCTC 7863]
TDTTPPTITLPQEVIAYRGEEFEFFVETTDDSGRVNRVIVRNIEGADNSTYLDPNWIRYSTDNLSVPGNATPANPLRTRVYGIVPINHGVGPGDRYTKYVRAEDAAGNITALVDKQSERFVLVIRPQTEKYTPQVPTLTYVQNANSLTQTDKDAVIAAVKSANPNLPATSTYSVSENGTVTITYPDGSTDTIAAAQTVDTDRVAPVFVDEGRDYIFYRGEEGTAELHFYDNSGKITNVNFAGDLAASSTYNTLLGLGFTFNTPNINNPNNATEQNPLVTTIRGTIPKSLPAGPGGKYTFKVRATDASGLTSEAKIFRIVFANQTDKYTPNNPGSLTGVLNPQQLSTSEKTAIEEKVRAANTGNLPNNVQYVVNNDGSVTVIYPDDTPASRSRDTITADRTVQDLRPRNS